MTRLSARPTVTPPAALWVGWRRNRPRDCLRRGGWEPVCGADSAKACVALLAARCDPATQDACCLMRGAHPDGRISSMASATKSPCVPRPDRGRERRPGSLPARLLACLRPGEWAGAQALASRLGLPGPPSDVLSDLYRGGELRRRRSPNPSGRRGWGYEYALPEGGAG